jgi:hypothetical protein
MSSNNELSKIEYYNEEIKYLNTKISNKEDYHEIRDAIYEEFIEDIDKNNLNLYEIGIIAKLINEKMIKKKVGVWYA